MIFLFNRGKNSQAKHVDFLQGSGGFRCSIELIFQERVMHQPVETTKEVPIPMVQEMIFDFSMKFGFRRKGRVWRMYGENTWCIRPLENSLKKNRCRWKRPMI